MRIAFKVLALLVFANAPISYFKYSREVKGGGDHQQYVVVDETVWEHARPDLADLRLYAGPNEVPYALSVERGSSETERKEVPVVDQGILDGVTLFFLDMRALTEYDHVELELSARNYVSRVQVDAGDNLHGSRWVTLRHSIIYDLSEDNLGSNTMLRLPLTRYKYLRVTIDPSVPPSDVKGAWAEIREEEKQVWRRVPADPRHEEKGKDTVYEFFVPQNVPVEQLEFTIDPAQPNFRREVEVRSDKNGRLQSGEISRVHMVRHGQKIDFEQSSIDLNWSDGGTIKVIIHNGDDPPLKITGTLLEQHQRRLYFNSTSAPQLYYGDERLDSPVYDYAKLFQKDPQAIEVKLGSEQSNSAYTGRPDERPWTEKHPAVLWVAIVAAVVVLGAMALRAMRQGTVNSE